MSVISLDMIEKFAAHNGVSLEDGTQYPGVVGSLKAWEAGQGELQSDLVDAGANKEAFAPLVEAYNAAIAARNQEGGQEAGQEEKQA